VVTDTRGSLSLDINAAGTLANPKLAGELQLSEAAFHAPDLGVEVSHMNLHGVTTDQGDYRIRGSWLAGEGNMQLDASLAEAANGFQMQATVTGEDAEIINLPEIHARATPDLLVTLAPRRRSVSGDILVKHALIDLDEMSSGTPVSDDVVLVDGKGKPKQHKQITRQTNLTLQFGDDIRVKGKGITGRLGGQLALSNNDQGDVIATGEISIRDGTYSAYGQTLKIEEGRLIYQQAKLDNPELRIRAVRQVEDIRAGVQVVGYLSNPVVTLFSSPSMNQEQILSYVVFGRPLNSLSSGEGTDLIGAATSLGLRNSGFITNSLANTFGLDELRVKTEPGAGAENASLIIGKYLTPSLYLSYGIGLYETISTARIRYDITKRWAVEAEQGEELGADILFKVEF
jgi:translocation and assembly module TamB